jgi:hypothetical protein
MTTTSRLRNFAWRSLLFAGVAALAVTASGCYGDSGYNNNGYGGSGCSPDLFVDWQIQNSTGAPVTCTGAGAATVLVTIDSAPYPQKCVPSDSTGFIDPFLQGTGTYNVTVALFDDQGNSLAPAQSVSLDINSCGSFQTPGPAVLVVSPSGS